MFLENLIVIVDKNNLQIDGSTCDIKSIDPLDEKLRAFGFEVYQMDGHDYDEVEKLLIEGSKKVRKIAIETLKRAREAVGL